ncbi:MAG: tetratricopeptide repeat protein [Candidatus Obscuribacterales bacterium]|nr:tetratricopeptide repeat protein [Candidatus Obscuribacterales bacterium]
MPADFNQPSNTLDDSSDLLGSEIQRQVPQSDPVCTFNFDSRSLAKLAQATSSSIAWLLIMPDAIALLPNSDDPVTYFLRLLGLWVSAAVLWFVSFWGILNVVRVTVAEVTISPAGIKLWRFAKTIPWENVQAIEIAPQLVFSKFFSLSETARRLTLFESRKSGPKILRGRLITHNIPSFLFSTRDFDQLASAIVQHRFGLSCQLQNVFLFEPQAVRRIKRLNKVAGVQRLLITALIAFGLVSVLGRKAIVNYSYNYGNKCLVEGDLTEAKSRYQTALAFEPGFSAALNNLALAEFRTGDIDSARAHWQRAIAFKPDYVEAKISLAHLCLKERQFEQANSFIEKALNIAPLNPYATLKRAEYNMRLGRSRVALADARAVTTQAPSNQVASAAFCLIAQAKLRSGDIDGAQKSLSQLSHLPNPTDSEFKSYRALVESQVALELKDFATAEEYARLALRFDDGDAECTQNLVHILVLQNKLPVAEKLAFQAVAKNTTSPFGYIALVEVETAQKRFEEASQQLSIAEKLTSRDAYSSRLLASEALTLGHRDRAIDLLRRALKIDASSEQAKRLEYLQREAVMSKKEKSDAKLFSSQQTKPEH